MNARTIKSRFKKAGLNLEQFTIENAHTVYYVSFNDYGFSDNYIVNNGITGDMVIAKKENDNQKISLAMSQFDGVEKVHSSMFTIDKSKN